MDFAVGCNPDTVWIIMLLWRSHDFKIIYIDKVQHSQFEPLQVARTVQKHRNGRINLISSNKPTSLFKRSQFCFKLYSLIIAEIDVFGYAVPQPTDCVKLQNPIKSIMGLSFIQFASVKSYV